MNTTHRSYSEAAGDFHRLCRMMIDNRDALRAYSTWCMVRFVDWRYGLYENKRATVDFWAENAELWFDGFGDVAGLAISESGDGGFAIITARGYRFLFAELLEWVLAHWGARPPRLSVEITALQAAEAAALERAGFQLRSDFWTQCFDLSGEPAPRAPLEPGFTIVDMATHPDYRAQRILRADAFQGKSNLSEAEIQRHLAFYNYGHQGPVYHPQTDLCVMAPDGRLVSGCEALIDAHNEEADIERVCTHSEFRRRGFARAVIQECLARLREMGLRWAYITGYSREALALYGSLGAVEETKALIYER